MFCNSSYWGCVPESDFKNVSLRPHIFRLTLLFYESTKRCLQDLMQKKNTLLFSSCLSLLVPVSLKNEERPDWSSLTGLSRHRPPCVHTNCAVFCVDWTSQYFNRIYLVSRPAENQRGHGSLIFYNMGQIKVKSVFVWTASSWYIICYKGHK